MKQIVAAAHIVVSVSCSCTAQHSRSRLLFEPCEHSQCLWMIMCFGVGRGSFWNGETMLVWSEIVDSMCFSKVAREMDVKQPHTYSIPAMKTCKRAFVYSRYVFSFLKFLIVNPWFCPSDFVFLQMRVKCIGIHCKKPMWFMRERRTALNFLRSHLCQTINPSQPSYIQHDVISFIRVKRRHRACCGE